MRLKTLRIKNFRGYRDEVTIDFCELTAFVGKNDAGKSTVLEALDVFFYDGKGTVKIEKSDINKYAALEDDLEICISVCFEDLPDKVVVDATYETTLQSQYLLNSNSQLEIIKKFPNAGAVKTYVLANHPTNPECSDLLLKKASELRTYIDKKGISCTDKSTSAIMRTAIWDNYSDDLQLSEVEIDISKGDVKSIWDRLQNTLPHYALFQSDRKNSDGDSEVQDPLKEATKQILNDPELSKKLADVASEVKIKLQEVSARTLEKLREMNPEIANSLNPVIPSVASLKWSDVFKSVSITGDEDIPINKRGSGVKRLILLNFFRAEAERKLEERNNKNIIYAIEEPETSQHTEHQKIMIKAFLSLVEDDRTQIAITTHSAMIVKELDYSNLRMILKDGNSTTVLPVMSGQLPYPSLNEVNYLAFSEISEEYHNDLYGFLEAEDKLDAFKSNKETVEYMRILRDGGTRTDQITLTEYIRHQIHHPENTNNPRYTYSQLKESISLMRNFIQSI